MSASLPDVMDAWRMLAAQRSFAGVIPLSSMPRLCEALEQPEGDCSFVLSFDRGALDVPRIRIEAKTRLPLLCQRSLQRFWLPVTVDQSLALVADEHQEAALPEGYEAVVVDAEGAIRPLDLIEDELILALPVVAIDPDGAPIQSATTDDGRGNEQATMKQDNPFAVLADFHRNKQREQS
ncbi:MAG: DUF177 domain-containing protein [Proteobacteria bacterium]|nr:DUF177 domain-containing protein [Pseudomonadota bacterium]